MKNYKNLGYGNFLQEGGEPMPDQNGEQMVEQVEQAPGNKDPQALAKQFLEAFAQLPPEVQQMIHDAIMQQMQQG